MSHNASIVSGNKNQWNQACGITVQWQFMHKHTLYQLPLSINAIIMQQILESNVCPLDEESNVCPLDERYLAMQEWENQCKMHTLHI